MRSKATENEYTPAVCYHEGTESVIQVEVQIFQGPDSIQFLRNLFHTDGEKKEGENLSVLMIHSFTRMKATGQKMS